MEPLEERCLLAAAPTLDVVEEVTVQAGAPVHLVLDGFDADGDALTFTATSDNESLAEPFIPEGNRSMRISVADYGDMVFELFEGRAPRTTGRIIELAEDGFYEDVIFHRIIKDFMIQGGDPTGTGSGGPAVQFDDEFHSDLMHTVSGILSMAKGRDDSNGSQFFVTSGPTRHLDFNHSIFGLLTVGDDIREQIENVDTDESDKPETDVVMESVEIFTDTQNGVLMISAPEGASGETFVHVTVSDGADGTQTKTIKVTVEPDAEGNNSPPYLHPVGDLRVRGSSPTEIDLFSTDVEGDPTYYVAWPRASWDSPFPDSELQLDMNYDNGQGSVASINATPGVHGILVGVSPLSYEQVDYRDSDPATWSDEFSSYWDFQFVPVLVDPDAPTGVELLASADTGADDSDGLTRLNNSNQENSLSFRVSGVLPGATVYIYADGQPLGNVVAAGDSVVVSTDGTLPLSDGSHEITARQVLPDQPVNVGNRTDTATLFSSLTTPIDITIETVVPEIVSTPIEIASQGAPYVYNAQANETSTYRLTQSPAGMLIDSNTGRVTWTPQPGQGPTQAVTIVATDVAGNESSPQTYSIQILNAPDIRPIDDQQIAEGSLLTLTAEVDGADASVVFSLTGTVPAGATIDPSTGAFRWRPSEAQGPGDHLISVKATGDDGAAATETFKVTVTEINVPPQLDPISDKIVNEGQTLEFTVGVTDPDLPANALTFSLHGDVPAGAAVDSSTGRFTFPASESQGGNSYTVVVRVTDGLSSPDEQSFTIQVNELYNPPVFDPIEIQFVRPGEDLELVVRAVDPDVPPEPIAYSLEPGAPDGAAIDPDSGLLTWSVPEDFERHSVEIEVRATEMTAAGPGLSSVAVVRVDLFDLDDLAFVVAAASVTTDQSAIAPSPELWFEMFNASDEPAGQSSGTVQDDPLSPDGAVPTDLFGSRIGVRGGSGGVIESGDEPDDEETPEQPSAENTDETGGTPADGEEVMVSDAGTSTAADAAMAQLAVENAADEQLTEAEIRALLAMLNL